MAEAQVRVIDFGYEKRRPRVGASWGLLLGVLEDVVNGAAVHPWWRDPLQELLLRESRGSKDPWISAVVGVREGGMRASLSHLLLLLVAERIRQERQRNGLRHRARGNVKCLACDGPLDDPDRPICAPCLSTVLQVGLP